MRIGCLVWGSLFWDPRTLPVAGDFQEDGPRLPIEFSRVALDGRVTLVIDRRMPGLRVLWVPLAVDALDEAVRALGEREKIAPARVSEWVGRRTREASARAAARDEVDPALRQIDRWLREGASDLDAVVWTALPGRFPDGRVGMPDFEALLAHLESLEGEARARAEEYVRRTPGVIRTANRAGFETRLGWTPQASD